MAQDQHIKPSLSQLMDQILEKLFLANIKGSYMISTNFFRPRLETIFIPLSLKTTRNNPTSPHNGPIKIFFTKPLCIFKNNKQWNSTKFKIEAKKNSDVQLGSYRNTWQAQQTLFTNSLTLSNSSLWIDWMFMLKIQSIIFARRLILLH